MDVTVENRSKLFHLFVLICSCQETDESTTEEEHSCLTYFRKTDQRLDILSTCLCPYALALIHRMPVKEKPKTISVRSDSFHSVDIFTQAKYPVD